MNNRIEKIKFLQQVAAGEIEPLQVTKKYFLCSEDGGLEIVT